MFITHYGRVADLEGELGSGMVANAHMGYVRRWERFFFFF